MTEFVTAPDGVRIAWETVGDGPPVLLVHGFGSNRVQNWRAPGWYDTLTGAGYSVIALDNRGHGESDKPHELAAYAEQRMAEDAALVMTAAECVNVFVMGYSMGGAIALRLAHEHPERVRALVTGGVGETYFTRDQSWRNAIAEAILVDDVTQLSPVQRMFRDFAAQPGKDGIALAACMRAPRFNLDCTQLAAIGSPTLVVCGETDDVSGPAQPLASALGNARAMTVHKRDHMLTVGDKVYKQAVLEFLGAHQA
ncbi:MAG TPA: alpha/beta hydrolase [Rhizomicrobium sp.]|jgi:non-heme chloroperoxidase|nr:alpha/beta hydrolase [Rhizomicrobium sp.]